jgi:hypothetical protein
LLLSIETTPTHVWVLYPYVLDVTSSAKTIVLTGAEAPDVAVVLLVDDDLVHDLSLSEDCD